MTITVNLAPELEAELARQAATQGVAIDAYAALLIENAARLHDAPVAMSGQPQLSAPSHEVVEAIEALKRFGKAHRLSLGGMSIRELRHEARP